MDAGLIQLVLIHALLRPEFPHEVRIAVTACTELGDGLTRRLTDESLGTVHGPARIVTSAVAAMAV